MTLGLLFLGMIFVVVRIVNLWVGRYMVKLGGR